MGEIPRDDGLFRLGTILVKGQSDYDLRGFFRRGDFENVRYELGIVKVGYEVEGCIGVS